MLQYNGSLETAKELISSKKYAEAKNLLTSLLNNEASNAGVIFELAKIYQIQGDDLSAETEYKKVLAIDSGYHLAKLELARIYLRQRRLDMSLLYYKDYIKDFPGQAEILKELAVLYNLQGSISESMDSLEKAYTIHPDNVEVLFELGRAYREKGNNEKAIESFNKIYGLIDAGDKFLSNKILNEIETTQGKEVLTSKVRSMIAMIVDKCNIKCRMCGIWKGTWQVRDSVMKEIVDLFPYMADISWQGGEVFMMKGFDDILKEGTRHKNLKQVIFTNGLLINEKILEKLDKGKIDIVFSIDAVDKATYEYIRFGSKYEKLLKVLELVKEFRKKRENNISIYINAVIMKSNYDKLENFVDFADKYQFNAITFSPVKGCNDEDIFFLKDKNKIDNLQLSLQKAKKRALEFGIRLNDWVPIEHPNEAVNISDKKSNSRESLDQKVNKTLCYVPWQRLCIDCNGMVRPFGFCTKRFVGNTDTMSLSEIWNGEGMRYFRKKLVNNDYKDLCEPECISGQVRDKICRVD